MNHNHCKYQLSYIFRNLMSNSRIFLFDDHKKFHFSMPNTNYYEARNHLNTFGNELSFHKLHSLTHMKLSIAKLRSCKKTQKYTQCRLSLLSMCPNYKPNSLNLTYNCCSLLGMKHMKSLRIDKMWIEDIFGKFHCKSNCNQFCKLSRRWSFYKPHNLKYMVNMFLRECCKPYLTSSNDVY